MFGFFRRLTPRSPRFSSRRLMRAFPDIDGVCIVQLKCVALFTCLLTLLAHPVPVAAQNYIFVTSLEDRVSGGAGCSLQEAIYSATYKDSVTITSYKPDGTPIDGFTGCVKGSKTEEDVIVLPSGAQPAVFQLNRIIEDVDNSVGPTATPPIRSSITIEANGAELLWTGADHARAFVVEATGHLTIRNAYIKGFNARGGNGSRGGGGGLGAGGAIFVKGGGLVIENSTFDGNSAVGGNGSANVNRDESGGGGGLSGNGGNPGIQGGGGGGGGSRGNGEQGGDGSHSFGRGGVGGGTLNSSGVLCGGGGGGSALKLTDADGREGSCPGGGGGGGVGIGASLFFFSTSGKGGNGSYGGGGGGSGNPTTDGGNGGFGGGGGGGATAQSNLSGFGPYGGNGGFGGGGGTGGGGFLEINAGPGAGGDWGGKASNNFGGGGGALGGAIFNHAGSVVIRNSTFSNNFVNRGNSGGVPAENGADAGAAIFSLYGRLSVEYSTISGNHSTGSRAGIEVSQAPLFVGNIAVYPATTFTIYNSIVANNGAQECSVEGPSIVLDGFGNLIVNNSGCPGVVSSSDPLLGPLQINQSFMPLLAIGTNSPAWNSAIPATFLPSDDQRGQTRPRMGGYDIGAFELCVDRFLNPCQLPPLTAIPNTLKIVVNPAGAGTTTPPEGNTDVFPNAVQTLTATPNAGFSFLNWTGNVADPTSQATAIVMTQDQDVTANFIACTCAGNVSTSVSVKRLGFVLNPATKRYGQTITVTNTSTHIITGPTSLVLDSLSANATLFNATGITDSLEQPAGSPYLNSNGNLAPGQSVSFSLQFTDPTNTAISYTTRVLAGPGSR